MVAGVAVAGLVQAEVMPFGVPPVEHLHEQPAAVAASAAVVAFAADAKTSFEEERPWWELQRQLVQAEQPVVVEVVVAGVAWPRMDQLLAQLLAEALELAHRCCQRDHLA